MRFAKTMRQYNNPEKMAQVFLSSYFGDRKIEYPINPFQMLLDEGVLFFFSEFSNLDGIYLPASGQDDIPLVGINLNRPITRQRFTAAHELCHHLRDAERQLPWPLSENE